MSSPHLLTFESLNSLFKGIIVAQFAKEGLVRRRLRIIEVFWIIQPFLWKINFRLWSLLGIQERIKARSSSEKFYFFQQLNISKLGGDQLICLLDHWYNTSFFNKERQQVTFYFKNVVIWAVERKDWDNVARTFQMILQIKKLILLFL